MRVYISADIEGVSGVATWDQARTDGPDHPRARIWMTEDVNAAVAGAVEAGASDVVVRDAHGRARNILWDGLHPAARLISGWDPRIDMLMGLDGSFGLVMLVGYHPGPSAPRGVLSHAFTGRIREMRLNGTICNEAIFAAVQAGALGVHVGLVTGQIELLDEIRPVMPECMFVATKIELLDEIRPVMPECMFVATKRGLAYQAALLEPMSTVRANIHAAARGATAAAIAGRAPAPVLPTSPLRLEVDLASAEAAEAIEQLEGVERTTANQCVLHAQDGPAFVSRFFLMLQILYAVKDNA
jgi:D-amino peptidase